MSSVLRAFQVLCHLILMSNESDTIIFQILQMRKLKQVWYLTKGHTVSDRVRSEIQVVWFQMQLITTMLWYLPD